MKIKSYLIIAGILALGIITNNYFDNKRELARQEFNEKNYLLELRAFKDSIKSTLIQYQFKTNSDLEGYLKATSTQLNGINEKLVEADIKLRQVTRIVSTTVTTRDTIINKISLDSLAEKLSSLKPFKLPFAELSDCFFIRGEFAFDGQSYEINLLEKKYTDTLTHVSSWERKKHRWLFGIKTGLFGKKVGKLTLFNNCGESKIIILDKL